MHYAIRHITRFTYDAPIRESVMEIRMQPRTELAQRCLRFELATQPWKGQRLRSRPKTFDV